MNAPLSAGSANPGGGPVRWLRDHVVSLGFYLYALLAAPSLARALKAGLADPAPLWLPGGLLLAILMLEVPALRWKCRFLRRRNAEDGFQPEGEMFALFCAVTIGHMIVTLLAGMLALDCWGLVGNGSENLSAWGAVLFTALIFKEFAALFACAGQSVSPEPPGHPKETFADILLLAYGCVAYTAWWEVIVDMGEIAQSPLVERLAFLPVLALLFLFFYLPMRLPFLLEEHYRRPARGRRARILIELAGGLILGVYPAFF